MIDWLRDQGARRWRKLTPAIKKSLIEESKTSRNSHRLKRAKSYVKTQKKKNNTIKYKIIRLINKITKENINRSFRKVKSSAQVLQSLNWKAIH